MSNGTVRVGLIGAGRNTRDRHIPGFQKIQEVEIVAVANRSRESGQRVAEQFGIPQVYDNWQALLEDDSIDAVCIGTWPYMHRAITLAALAKNKHVLCEARMATTAQEARDMLAASRANPHLVSQIVPSPLSFKVDGLLNQLIGDGYLGNLLAVELQALAPGFVDLDGPLHWRNDRDLSGYNILNMGIWYEAMIRWVGRATEVMAMTTVTVPFRNDDDGNRVGITIPDHVDVLCRLADGAQAHLRVSAVTGLSPGNEVWLYGSEGTLRLDGKLNVYGGKRGDRELSEIANPPEKQYSWRVEAEFIGAIRGEELVTHTPFSVGVHYMEWTEAVTRSAQTGQVVSLPL
ncbi:MAG: Gfo/Idh/MocA family oxidoreductase [Dehalococcoidia bacterium]|nr:Gfo/Idh/MocA family oxidoreductase [Dehalococcoidia bacterium]MDP7200865.1 Gfo/Idh/MocA family oxidoreductase [Dehalococcoidia bacterium]MDP7510772.1 Gfo/Idh/MocA family oxidoreductase [Dehalococcoidia bacterium]HJN85771.1 Gfo/Idh/MocA family oxidoreductase [Dehalococcoidia bacterium]